MGYKRAVRGEIAELRHVNLGERTLDAGSKGGV